MQRGTPVPLMLDRLTSRRDEAQQPTTDDRPLRVLIVDDHDFFRAGVRSVLTEHGLEVVGEAPTATAALPLAAVRAPDVILMDLNMPGMNGVEATRRLAEDGVEAAVVVLTVSSDPADVIDALEAGAAGYLLKNAAPDEIVRSVESAAAGDSPLSPRVARYLIERSRSRTRRSLSGPVRDAVLSERELDVLRLIAQGLDNNKIAAQIYLSPATVKRHVSTILMKLGVSNRVQAAIEGVQRGLI
jgi:DNA-binding NarL/FixJ family response regulator